MFSFFYSNYRPIYLRVVIIIYSMFYVFRIFIFDKCKSLLSAVYRISRLMNVYYNSESAKNSG